MLFTCRIRHDYKEGHDYFGTGKMPACLFLLNCFTLKTKAIKARTQMYFHQFEDYIKLRFTA